MAQATPIEFASGEVVCRSDLGQKIHGMTLPAGSSVTVHARSDNLRVISYEDKSNSEQILIDRGLEIEKKNLSQGRKLFCSPNYIYHQSIEPNDTYWSDLWGMTKIKAPTIWNQSTGSASVLVGIVDTGIQTSHPDLTSNIAVNSGEIPSNNQDDDQNGRIDDVYGFNFVSNNGSVNDDNGHGTHVAGTIGAVGNNNRGVVGVNWNVGIIAAKALNSEGAGSLADIADAINYLRIRGVKVINLSLGGPVGSSALYTTLLAAANAGIMISIAAGNESTNNDSVPSYPANYSFPSSLTVAATTITDGLASFSNYGLATVHLGAPGEDITSTYIGSGYAVGSGTSMASPHVAGAAALLKALYPARNGAEIRNCILNGTERVTGLTNKVYSQGRLNVVNAASLCASGNQTPTPTPAVTATPSPTATPDSGNALPPPTTEPISAIILSPTLTTSQKGVNAIEIKGSIAVTRDSIGLTGTEVDRSCAFKLPKGKGSVSYHKISSAKDGVITVKDKVAKSAFLRLKKRDVVKVTCDLKNPLAENSTFHTSLRWKR